MKTIGALLSTTIIDEAAAAVGREPSDIRTIFNFPGRITDRPLPATRDEEGRWIGGNTQQWIEELTGAVLDYNAAGFILFSPGGTAPDLESLQRWSGDIVPAVREAIGQGK
ncbi:hypothetical protein [Nocardia terpenica]|uniref:hypothetical protein n=1 Tax=Nocardia terpenica TaxID=455432 RepID=UPI0018E095D2|nr:hypothetical protein [Nocardia terpenica]